MRFLRQQRNNSEQRRAVWLRSLAKWADNMDPVRQFQLSLLLLLGLMLVGVVGYHYLEGMPWVDGAYMTIITLTTVGFGEVYPLSPAGRLFTMMLILLGVGVSAYAVSNAVEIIVGNSLWISMGERQMQQRIDGMQGHYIVCGYGRMGRAIVHEFERRGEPFVVVDNAEALHTQLLEADVTHIIGDATHDETLLRAGVERAGGLLAVVDSDGDNVLIVLSARGLNPTIKIVARAASEEMEGKLKRAGADQVTSPYEIGGQRMAFAMVRPAVYKFLDTAVYSEALHIEMGQLQVRTASPLVGLSLRQCNLRSRWGASVVAIVTRDGQTIISPDPMRRIDVGDILIVVAPSENMSRLEEGHI